MSFLSRFFGLKADAATAAVKERFNLSQPEPEYPLRLGLGKSVSFGVNADHILAENLLRTKMPTNSVVVQSIGEFEIAGIKHYRFYLGNERDEIFILQLEMQKDSKDIVHEAILFSIEDEVEPQSEADWATWIAQGGLIGNINVAPYPDAPADELYVRTLEPRGGEYINPLKSRERIRHFTGFGEGNNITSTTENVAHVSMPYARTVTHDGGSCVEHNLLTTVEAADEASVLILVGLAVESVNIQVL